MLVYNNNVSFNVWHSVLIYFVLCNILYFFFCILFRGRSKNIIAIKFFPYIKHKQYQMYLSTYFFRFFTPHPSCKYKKQFKIKWCSKTGQLGKFVCIFLMFRFLYHKINPEIIIRKQNFFFPYSLFIIKLPLECIRVAFIWEKKL